MTLQMIDILRATATIMKDDPGNIRGSRRFRKLMPARWLAMAVMRTMGWSLPRIGMFMARDHTTVLHGLRRLQGLHQKDPERWEDLQQQVLFLAYRLQRKREEAEAKYLTMPLVADVKSLDKKEVGAT